MISKNDVEQAYRLFLGRAPENSEVVDRFTSAYDTIDQLRRAFIESVEFQQQIDTPRTDRLRPLSWDPISVQIDVTDGELQLMLRHVEQSWESLGNTDLFWSVITDEKFRAAVIESNMDNFYESGRLSVEFLLKALARSGYSIDKAKSCVELGCGAGRITRWLAEQFGTVTACDISQPHLHAANHAIRRYQIENVDFVCTNSIERLKALPNFDVFFSLIVLQHNPPPVASWIIKSMLNKINPGGFGYFQIPTYSLGYHFDAKSYLSNTMEQMEMHVVPQKDIFSLFELTGCRVLEVREDDWTGSSHFISNTFLVQKNRD